MSKPSSETKKALTIFGLLLVGLSSIFYVLEINFPNGPYTTGLMWSVGISAVLTCLITKRDLKSLGWGWGKWKYQWLSYVIPLGYLVISYGIIWGADLGGFYNTGFVERIRNAYDIAGWSDGSVLLIYIAFTATIGMTGSLSNALGEEIGWRGFLAPELAKFMSFTGVVLVSGIIWSVWHWPIIWGGLYNNAGVGLVYQLSFFTMSVLMAATITTYLRFKSGNLWTATIFHASHNLFNQGVFVPLTIQYENTGKYIGEFGLVLPLVGLSFAIYFWNKGRKEFTS